jgi:hypothetical protein
LIKHAFFEGGQGRERTQDNFFRLFSHCITLPLSRSGSPLHALFACLERKSFKGMGNFLKAY